jgi:hypothetical protein
MIAIRGHIVFFFGVRMDKQIRVGCTLCYFGVSQSFMCDGAFLFGFLYHIMRRQY